MFFEKLFSKNIFRSLLFFIISKNLPLKGKFFEMVSRALPPGGSGGLGPPGISVNYPCLASAAAVPCPRALPPTFFRTEKFSTENFFGRKFFRPKFFSSEFFSSVHPSVVRPSVVRPSVRPSVVRPSDPDVLSTKKRRYHRVASPRHFRGQGTGLAEQRQSQETRVSEFKSVV